MTEPRTYKGRLVELLAVTGAAGPWRSIVERVACRVGHSFPSNRGVVSFCRHFGTVMVQREGRAFSRIVTFDSGGKMACSGNDQPALTCVMHYFLGTITSQDEDERPLLKMLSRAVRPGDTFFDIGANVGFYSFYFGPVCGPSGAVHAFEANPLLIEHLRRSAALNNATSNIVVNAVAVGKEANTTLQLYDPDRIGGSSLYPLAWLDAAQSVTVPLTTIDEYRRTKAINRLDVVKIDIEGSELDAFRGMKETFDSCPPWLIVCELALLIQPRTHTSGALASEGTRGTYAVEIIDFLQSKGYESRHIRSEDGLIAGLVDRDAIRRLSQNLINIAFVSKELKAARPELFAAAPHAAVDAA